MLETKDSHQHYQEQTLSSISISINGFITMCTKLYTQDDPIREDKVRCYWEHSEGT
jgi:hypothetical protein